MAEQENRPLSITKPRQRVEEIAQEKELETSFSLIKAAFDSTADGLLIVDNHGKIVQFNQNFLDLWWIPAVIIESKDDDQLLAFVVDQLQEPEKFLALVRKLYAQPEADSFDEIEFKDGRIFERCSQPQKIKGKSVGRVWIFRDITARMSAEDALQQSQALFHDLYETSQDLIWQCDASGRYTYKRVLEGICLKVRTVLNSDYLSPITL